MKNALRRIVPILLAVAVLGCAVWYLFVYDRDFTRDMLVTQARQLDDAGHHELAAWFYDQAYRHADNDAAVAIELSQQYREIKNYTKAEYTLTKAISKNPSAELYIALSRIFVEQDKLIDAVALLDKISDPSLKLELDSIRPAAPEASQTPGFYSEYISVDLACEKGTLLYSLDREYPSVQEDFYRDPIALDQGETTVYALCVGENGLVSPLAIYGYTIGGVIEEVSFADPAIEREIRNILNVDEASVIYSNQLWDITELTVPQDATVYTDLSKLTGLTALTIYNANEAELGILSTLPQLQTLTITGCEMNRQTLNTISTMSGMTQLTLAHCELSDIFPLSSLTKLTYLDLSHNFIKDLSPLSGLSSLETLYLTNNAVVELSPLGGLSRLITLNVSYNSIPSLMPVCSIRSLQNLVVSHNLLEDLGDLDLLPQLQLLDASYNQLTAVAVLGRCNALAEINISNNSITSIEPLEELTELMDLDCSYNQITTLPDWSPACPMVYLNASYNNIKDITPLGALPSLNRINLDYNPRLKTIEALASCPNLIEVDLFGTKVTDVTILTDMSIIVNYNPTDVDVDVPEINE